MPRLLCGKSDGQHGHQQWTRPKAGPYRRKRRWECRSPPPAGRSGFDICAGAPSSGRRARRRTVRPPPVWAVQRLGVSASRAPFQRFRHGGGIALRVGIMGDAHDKTVLVQQPATTKPSPPLLPGPQSTVTVQGLKRAAIASATARPAFFIRVSDGTPCATAKASACPFAHW